MPNMRLILSSLIDTANTLTATSEDLPIDNIQNKLRGTAWKSTTAAAQVISSTFNADGASGFSIARHNISSTGSIRLVLKLDSVIVYDSGEVSTAIFISAGIWRAGIDPFGATYNDKTQVNIFTLWFDNVVCDEMELTITDNANTDGFIYIERAFLGFAFEPEINPFYGMPLTHSQGFRHLRTGRGGSVTVGNSVIIRSMNLDFGIMTESDRNYLEVELNITGADSDMLISIYPEEGGIRELQNTMICVREPEISFVKNHFKFNSFTATFTEV